MPQIRKGKANPAYKFAQQTICCAGHGILLVNARGQATNKCGEYGGKCGITAKAHDHIGLPFANQFSGLEDAPGHCCHSGQGFQPAPEHPAYSKPVKLKPGPGDKIGLRSVLAAHKQNFRVGQSFFQCFGHGQRGENMPTRAAGGENDA